MIICSSTESINRNLILYMLFIFLRRLYTLYCVDCRRGPSVLAPTAHKPSVCLWAWSGENFLGPSRCWWVGHRIGRRTGRAAVEAWMAAQHRSERPPPKSTTGGRRSRGAVLLLLLLPPPKPRRGRRPRHAKPTLLRFRRARSLPANGAAPHCSSALPRSRETASLLGCALLSERLPSAHDSRHAML